VTERLSPEVLAACFDVSYALRHVDTIFERFAGNAVDPLVEVASTYTDRVLEKR
jgi:hypothetical protein